MSIPILCTTIEKLSEIINKYEEQTVFVGADDLHNVKNMNFVLFHNKKTGTYSAVFVSVDAKQVCVVSSGNGKIIEK